MHTGHEFTLQGVFNLGQQVVAVALDLAVGIGQIEVDRLRRDLEFGEQVADDAAIGIQDFTLQCTHTQMLERDGVLVAHRSEEHTSEHQPLMRIAYAVLSLNKKTVRPYNNNNKRERINQD